MTTSSVLNECMLVMFLNFINLISTFHNIMVTSVVWQMYMAMSLSVSQSPACFHVVTQHVKPCKVMYLDWAVTFDVLIKAQADHPSQAT